MSEGKKKQSKGDKEEDPLDIQVNRFGEIESNIDIDRINAFLDKKVKDKKLTKQDTDSEEE